MRTFLSLFVLVVPLASAQNLLPSGWDTALESDLVMQRLINTSAPQVKGAHDAEFVCVAERAYLVAEANDLKASESAGWPFIHATMSIVNLQTLRVEKISDFAKSEQVFEHKTLPSARVSCHAFCKRMSARCPSTSRAKLPASANHKCHIATLT